MTIQNVTPTIVGKDVRGRSIFMARIKCDSCFTIRPAIRVEGDNLCYETCQACGKRIYFRISNKA